MYIGIDGSYLNFIRFDNDHRSKKYSKHSSVYKYNK